MSSEPCYHCGLPLGNGGTYELEIAGQTQKFCCPGCVAVASTIQSCGLDNFYRYRTADPPRPDTVESADQAWDIPELQAGYVTQPQSGQNQVLLALRGITCTACTWLIEKYLRRLPGLINVRVNGTTHRAEVTWDPQQLKLSQILSAVRAIGYQAMPVNRQSDYPDAARETRSMLMRLGLAGLAMMQAGMVAIGLYAGAFQGIEPRWELLLRWVSLILVTPVVFYSAQPFFAAAWRNLRLGHLVMDLPVSLAISLAYAASIWATWRGGGEVYFDSIAMFTFFLLLGRFLEQRIRYRNLLSLVSTAEILPPFVVRLDSGREDKIPLASLQLGDRILVGAGETIPCDGLITQGSSQVEEAILTGESKPISKKAGDRVSAGTVNGANPLQLEVTALGEQTRLSTLLRLVEEGGMEKPHWAGVADRLAGWFVGLVLLIALAVFSFWWMVEPERALWVTLSVLVVTCPCALSLATPTALSVATGKLREAGFLITRGHALESLAQIDQVLFDKTGTLTLGQLGVKKVICLADRGAEELLQIAAALEKGGHHPIGKALKKIWAEQARDQEFVTGCGVHGKIGNQIYYFGSPEWVAGYLGEPVPEISEAGGIMVALASGDEWLGVLIFDDDLRDTAAQALQSLQANHLGVGILSGDPSPGAVQIARDLNLADSHFGLQPEQKLNIIRARQAEGHRVMMVGDGINDVPVLQMADISVAMGQASDLARMRADAILLSPDLNTLSLAYKTGVRTRRIILQNLSWALGYNLLAIPLAAAGWVPPWAAAIGMSASSLVVLLNALRLQKEVK